MADEPDRNGSGSGAGCTDATADDRWATFCAAKGLDPADPRPLVSTRDKSTPDPPPEASWGCERPSQTAFWLLPDGVLVPLRCGASNRCWYCAWLSALETSVVLGLDARQEAPRVGLTLTTVDPQHDLDRFRRDTEKAFLLLRRRLGRDMRYCGFMEWTTGRGRRSGGHRRVHLHALVKGAEPAAAEAVEADLRDLWQRRTGASRVELRELRTAAGATAYLTLHHHKREQAPPPGFTGRRLRPSRGYYARPIADLREEARDLLRDKRVQEAARALVDRRLLEDPDLEDERDELLTEAIDRARAQAAQGVRLVRLDPTTGRLHGA